jgi:hypothetical protein
VNLEQDTPLAGDHLGPAVAQAAERRVLLQASRSAVLTIAKIASTISGDGPPRAQVAAVRLLLREWAETFQVPVASGTDPAGGEGLAPAGSRDTARWPPGGPCPDCNGGRRV